MSMVFCITCGEMRDSDAEPEGFYTLKFPDDYVCDECRERHDIRTQFDEETQPLTEASYEHE